MPSQTFILLGEDVSTAKDIDIDTSQSIDEVKHLIAAHFAIVEPNGE